MSPDLNDALSHIKENDDWAYDLIKFQLEQLQKDKEELEKALEKIRDSDYEPSSGYPKWVAREAINSIGEDDE